MPRGESTGLDAAPARGSNSRMPSDPPDADIRDGDLQPPKRTAGDIAHAAGRSVFGVIPFGGTAAVELFNSVVTPPLERRRDEWREMVGERLLKLERAERVTLEGLQANEAFVSIAMQATLAALRTHVQEKREALRNAVLNAAITETPDDSLRQVFIGLVDTFTGWHLRILRFFRNPKQRFDDCNREAPVYHVAALSDILENAFADLKGRRAFYDLVIRDLHATGLLDVDILHVTRSGGFYDKRTNDLGDEFLAFIADPADSTE